MKCKYLIVIIFIGVICFGGQVFAKYILTRNFDVEITTVPFYFEAEVENAEIELIDNQVEINLIVKNNDGTNYNSYDTNYEVSLLDNEKFTVNNEDTVNTISGNSLMNEEIIINLELKEDVTLKTTEEISIKVACIEPYKKDIILKTTVIVNNEEVIPNFTFSNETYTITMGGYNVYRTSSNIILNESINISEMNYIEFDFYVPEGYDVTKIYPTDSQLEICSSGKFDESEMTYHTGNYFNEEIISGSWNHIIIPLSDGEMVLGECDLTNINFIGLYWNNNTLGNNNTYTIPNCQIKNFKFTKYIMNE